jgi:Ca2+-binding EF-hand superfamily protein
MSTTDTSAPVSKSRKQVVKKLSTGHKITLSTQDDRTLRSVYEYLSGFSSRRNIEGALEAKKIEVARLHAALPPSARLLLQMQPRATTAFGTNLIQSDADHHKADANAASKNESDVLLDEYYHAKDQLQKLEEKLKTHGSTDHKISFNDLDAVLKSLGPPFSKKQIKQMIWENDENLDEMIDFDELQLTYFRNIHDTTGNEPCLFFKILEFLICDGTHKGYIIEDDCMEILYARHGG